MLTSHRVFIRISKNKRRMHGTLENSVYVKPGRVSVTLTPSESHRNKVSSPLCTCQITSPRAVRADHVTLRAVHVQLAIMFGVSTWRSIYTTGGETKRLLARNARQQSRASLIFARATVKLRCHEAHVGVTWGRASRAVSTFTCSNSAGSPRSLSTF